MSGTLVFPATRQPAGSGFESGAADNKEGHQEGGGEAGRERGRGTTGRVNGPTPGTHTGRKAHTEPESTAQRTDTQFREVQPGAYATPVAGRGAKWPAQGGPNSGESALG